MCSRTPSSQTTSPPSRSPMTVMPRSMAGSTSWAVICLNPNTVARSYEILSDRKIIVKQRGVGFFVTGDAVDVIKSTERTRFLEEELPAFRDRAMYLGLDLNEILKR